MCERERFLMQNKKALVTVIAESERITEITFLENRIREGMEVIKNVNTKWYHHETEAVLSASLTRMDEKKSPDKTVKQSTSLLILPLLILFCKLTNAAVGRVLREFHSSMS